MGGIMWRDGKRQVKHAQENPQDESPLRGRNQHSPSGHGSRFRGDESCLFPSAPWFLRSRCDFAVSRVRINFSNHLLALVQHGVPDGDGGGHVERVQ